MSEISQKLNSILDTYGKLAASDKDIAVENSNIAASVLNQLPSWHTVVDHPLFNVAQVIPGLNIPTNAVAYASHMARGNTQGAMLDSLAMIPGVKGVGVVGTGVPVAIDAMRTWPGIAFGLSKNYPNAVAKSLNGIDSMPSLLESLRMLTRMTGRQIGVGMQAKQLGDIAVDSTKSAIELSN